MQTYCSHLLPIIQKISRSCCLNSHQQLFSVLSSFYSIETKKNWNEQATSTFDIPKKAPRKHIPFKNKVSKHSNAKFSQPLSKFYRSGFINKGNTCYMNVLSVLTGFWSTLPALASEEQDISPLVAAYCQITFCLNH